MSEFDQLGEALREQLHALVTDLHPSAELLASVDAMRDGRPARWAFLGRLTRRSRIAIAIPVPIAALAAAAILLLGGPTSSLATGVTVLPNGEVRLTLDQLSNVAAANAVLRHHHIHNIVVVPMTALCPDRNWTYIAGKAHPSPLNLFTPRSIPKGYTVVQASKDVTPDENLNAVGRFRGRLPTCASTHGWGAGMGDDRHWPPPKGQQG